MEPEVTLAAVELLLTRRPGAHVIEAGDGRVLPGLVSALCGRFGQPRTLALDGTVDPTMRWKSGASGVEVPRNRVREAYRWSLGNRELILTRGETADGRGVVTVAIRPVPGPAPAEAEWTGLWPATAWADQLLVLTGRESARLTHDWDAVQARLGSPLPADYRLLAEHFGPGTFDGYVDLRREPDQDVDAAREFREPVKVLHWASTQQGEQICLLARHAEPDPEHWRVGVLDDAGEWRTTHVGAAEFLYLALTELPLDVHTFTAGAA